MKPEGETVSARSVARRVGCGWVLAWLCLGLVVAQAADQKSKPAKPAATVNSAVQQRQRHDAWWLRGRTASADDTGAGAAARGLARARQQVGAMRAERLASAQAAVQVTGARAGPSAAAGASAKTPAAAAFVGAWIPLGPAPATSSTGAGADYGNVTGRVTALAVDAGDTSGNTVYAGAAYGGLWRSVNATAAAAQVTWTPLLDSAATLAVGAVALQPGNSKVILVGTGEANDALDSYYGQGILRSTDGAKTWTLIGNADRGIHPWRGLAFSRIAFSTDNTSLVVAATAESPIGDNNGAVPTGASLGLYGSSDAGATWSLVELFDAGVPVDSSAITSVVYSDAGHAFFAAARDHGFYTSTDGFNWSRLATQPGAALAASNCPAQLFGLPTSCPIVRGELAPVKGKNELYAWYVSLDGLGDTVQQGLFVSRNAGTSWSQLDETGFGQCGDLVGCGADQATYNMALTAVPDGSATDLYAGAVNLFRCTVGSGAASCMEGQWLNLTHAYGCIPLGAPAKVHPNLHALAYQVVNSKALFFAGNDGGVNRTLDAYLGLTSNSCTAGANAFDNLNAGLGSLAEVNGFAEDPSNLAVMLAGTEDNGSDATTTATTSLSWSAVNTGPAGPVQINPAKPSEWYTSNPGVSIQQCTSGATCSEADYQSHQVVSSSTVGEDVGSYYAPYLLDPESSGMMLVGTCRVWRGNTDGSNFGALSLNFETGTDAGCLGTETQVIRAMAAGGVNGSSGSPVIYALTEGGFNGSQQVGGKVWVATTASLGVANFADATSIVNPGNFPLAAIALDPEDSTAATGYVGVMGFGVSHVWKTTNFGANWSDFTGSKTGALPDSPVNALLIDSAAGLLYAATDVGVFQSALASASWSESGPVGGPFLPNVAAMQLALFNAGGEKRLRVGTYGRGVWELNLAPKPDYVLTSTATAQTVLVGQSATYTATLTSIFGYSSNVTLSCTAGSTAPPATCTVSPSTAVPSAIGKSVTVTASSLVAGDFTFNLQAIDGAGLTRSAPLILHATDYSLGAPIPGTVGTQRPGTTSVTAITVTPLGMMTGSVTFSCSGLPAGATCAFSPSSTVNLTPGNVATTNLQITVANTTPLASSVVTITAALSGASLKRTQTLTLNVSEGGDFALATVTPLGTVQSGVVATATASVSAINNFSPATNLTCSGTGILCTVSPTTVTSYPANVILTVATAGLAAGSYPVTLTGTSGAMVHTLALTLTATPAGDFALASVTPFAGVPIGQTATATASVSGLNSLTASTSLACSGTGISCTVSPNSVTAYPTNVTLTVPTTGLAVGSYSVTLTGTSGKTVHALALTVSISPAGDFTLATVTPFTTVPIGQSATATASVSALNSLGVSTSLACSGVGITCSVTPVTVSTYPVNITLTVATASLVAGSYPLSLTGSSGALSHSLDFTVNVSDYSVTPPSTASSPIFPAATASLTFSVKPVNQYAGRVNATCDVSAFGAGTVCTMSPANPIAVSSTGVSVVVTITTPANIAAGFYTANLVTSDAAIPSLSHSTGSLVTVTDYQVAPASGSDASTIKAGQQANFTVDVTPANGAFAATLTFGCSSLPNRSNCLFSPSSLTLNGPPSSVTMTVVTTSNVAALPQKHDVFYAYLLAFPSALGLALLPMLPRKRAFVFAMVVLLTLTLGVACGGGSTSQPPPPPPPQGTTPGKYTLTVTATATAASGGPTLAHSTQVVLNVQ